LCIALALPACLPTASTALAAPGSLECDGKNPAQAQSRVDACQRFASILGVSPGGNLYG
jgi:hypothetical protein